MYVFYPDESYDPMTNTWSSRKKEKSLISEEQKFRQKEIKIIFNKHLKDIEVYGWDNSLNKLHQDIELLKQKVKLWKDRQNGSTRTNRSREFINQASSYIQRQATE
jgi:hypothetical protein